MLVLNKSTYIIAVFGHLKYSLSHSSALGHICEPEGEQVLFLVLAKIKNIQAFGPIPEDEFTCQVLLKMAPKSFEE